jgi:hypothetical protein
VQCLLNELGNDVDKADEEGCTALRHAATAGNIAVIRLLVKVLGAAVDKADQKGGTALHHATASEHVALVRLLVNELFADVNKADLDGRTVLWIATCDGNLAIVKCLVNELGADIDKADRRGGTPLMAASAMKHADVVKWLVKAGANTQASAAFDGSEFTAAAFSNSLGASAEQTAYLEAKTVGRRASWPTGRRTRPTAGGGARSLRRAQGMQALDGDLLLYCYNCSSYEIDLVVSSHSWLPCNRQGTFTLIIKIPAKAACGGVW